MTDDLDRQYSPETLMQVGKLGVRLARHQKLGPAFRKIVREADPTYQLPPGDKLEDFKAELAAKQERDRITAEAAAVNARLEQQRRGLYDGSTLPGRKFDDAAIADIEKVMQKYGVSDYEAGAKIYAGESRQQPRPPHPGRSGNWTLPELPGLMDDPAAAARNAAYSLIDELQNGKR